MSILVVGSVAFDTVETPHGRVENVVAGAATYFALSASYFTPLRMVGVVGDDFKPEHERVLTRRGIDTRGLEHTPGRSFRWEGKYTGSMNEAKTVNTELNVFAAFEPKIPDKFMDSEYLFLANIDPKLQTRVRRQMPGVKMVCGDTMNYWIADHREALSVVLKELDVLLINDGEARMLSGESSLASAAEEILNMGPKSLVIKHGEHGATAFFGERSFSGGEPPPRPFRAPALPLKNLVDPTGAGDSFAGGFFGYIASQPSFSPAVFRRALFFGGVMGSFACESFGTERLAALTWSEIEERLAILFEVSQLEDAIK